MKKKKGGGGGERGRDNEKDREREGEREGGREGKERINHWDNALEYQREALGSDNIFKAVPMTYYIGGYRSTPI